MIIALNRTANISNSVKRIQSITCHLATRNMTSTSTNHSHKDGSTNWASNDGQFKRQVSSFRDEIKKGGKFEPEVGRYHLIVAYACPWAHRALIVRQLKGLDKVDNLLPYSSVDSLLGPEGWTFPPYEGEEFKGLGVPGTGNTVEGATDKKRIREFYLEADPDYNARCTVPVIWDKKLRTIVNNESSEIIRILNNCFDEFLPSSQQGKTYYPESQRKEIDELNSWVYTDCNNGVYKSGFATTQAAYESNVKPLFESLDRLEDLLKDGREFILGSEMTEADIRLFTTIIRFDPVYVGHFKCNHATIRQGYPKLNEWMKNLYWNYPAFKDTTHFDSIKAHYYQSHPQINPTRIIPDGPSPNIQPL